MERAFERPWQWAKALTERAGTVHSTTYSRLGHHYGIIFCTSKTS